MTAAPLVFPDPPNGIDGRVSTWMQQTKGKAYTFGLQSLQSVNRGTVGLNVTSDKLQSWGNGTFTTDGSGNISITHGLISAPNWATVQTLNNGTSAWIVNIISLGSGTINATVLAVDTFGTSTVNSTSVTVVWAARV